MFDAHIQYYAYNNKESDDFGVGYIGNKEEWIGRINRWNKNDKLATRVTAEDWDDLDCSTDLRGIQLAEVEPVDDSYKVSWDDGDNENSMIIDKNGAISWDNNPQNISSVPRWVTRLKNQLRDNEN